MQQKFAIRFLTTGSNEKGDKFGRLMIDFFGVLGYDDLRVNIQKAGREIDLRGAHRTEPSRMIVAECKATEAPIGGASVNKFIGSLDAERRQDEEKQVCGYFISLSGFTETAIEQEINCGNDRVVLIDSDAIIQELIRGRVVADPATVMEQAGRCAVDLPQDVQAETPFELLFQEAGLIWVVYFSRGKVRTHYCLVHADGKPLSQSLATTIAAEDKAKGEILHTLSYLSPKHSQGEEERLAAAHKHYLQYLLDECGEIRLEGLPTDQEVGSRRITLEDIFVPLYLHQTSVSSIASPQSKSRGNNRRRTKERKGIGEALAQNPRLAILGNPGSGKTTLLKRLAVAYGFPERRTLISDDLPDNPWLPLFIRCRELNAANIGNVSDLIYEIGRRAQMTDLLGPFNRLVTRSGFITSSGRS